jgi:glycosyltransferase involved in cell wall biosynthesis
MNKSIKIFDCSNSNERPVNRGNGCPLENDIMRYLKENSHKYNCIFVEDFSISDIIITNDVFPKYIQDINKPKIKRMDGIYWQYDLLDRNILLNNSAQIADHVIFISEFSKNSYFELYGSPLKSCSVCLNQVDHNIFYNYKNNIKDLIFIANASSWVREEKRFNNILKLAENIEEKLLLIGKLPENIKLPKNIISLDYINNPIDISKTLNMGSTFINFSYRDACPKVVVQALSCGLSTLYADSGGVKEMVESYGVGVEDKVKSKFEYTIPELDENLVYNEYVKFKNNWKDLRENLRKRNNKFRFENMLDNYFKVIYNYV